jgi:hypothetical protein
VRFRVRVETWTALDCNCTMCTKKGYLHLIVTKDAFELTSGADNLSTYTFNTHVAKHYFCKTCGIHAFYIARSHPDGFDVNVHCLDDADARARFTVEPFDGLHWEENVDAIR